MSNTILAIDQGTTSSRAIVFKEDATILGVAQKELKQFFPENGWVEHDAMMIWEDTNACVEQLLNKHKDIKTIGITNQRETTVIWDRETGLPIHKAIVWQDRRTAEYCRALSKDGHAEMIQQKTSLLLDAYFSATKIKWLLDNVEDAREKAQQGKLAFGTIECWLLWKLTDGRSHATDITNASRTMLFNIHEGQWDKELLALFDIDESLLPEVKPNIADFGMSIWDIPVQGMAGDQQAATIGQACFKPGMVKSTYGTGCFALLNTGDKAEISQNKLLGTVAYDLGEGPIYAIEGSIFNAGTAIQWLRDEMRLIKDAGDTQAMAESVKDSGGVYFVPAFTGLGAPYWDADARGLISGITRDTSKEHLVRATLEAQAYQTKDLIEAMEKDSGLAVKTMRVDGGMVKNDLVCQLLADILQIQVERPEIVETTALGAAYCAGLGAGLYKDKSIISDNWRVEKVFEPSISSDEAAKMIKGWKNAVKRSLPQE